MKDQESHSFGAHLRRLRESRGLSLRQAAKAADVSSGYLSQVEGGKRGKRKGGDHFAPHPQILQKLALVYHVEAYDLFKRAGFFEEAVSTYRGFSEARETDRCFDFVLLDPALKEILTLQDKRALIDRYEAQTGRKLLNWAAPSSPLRRKAAYAGLQLRDGRLYADTVDVSLTLEEVAEELGITVEDVRELVTQEYLTPSRTHEGSLQFMREQLLGFQQRLQVYGLQLTKAYDARHTPQTPAEYTAAARVIMEQETERAREVVRAAANRKTAKPQAKRGGETKS